MACACFRIKGVVQGVGFRPFVYRQAKKYGLTGWVLNDTEGVLTHVIGSDENIEEFKQSLKSDAPPAAVVTSVEANSSAAVIAINQKLGINITDDYLNNTEFKILPSPQGNNDDALASPDLATCPDCINELKNPTNRRCGYPFINCTNCGPRYSIIAAMPYDRPNTTMRKFKMCNSCQQEYENPEDRRFHAQPNACGGCGPNYQLLDGDGNSVENNAYNYIVKARTLLKNGKILAVKGIGGYHLVCDARNEQAVSELRRRKRRYRKPLAIMAGSLSMAKKICYVSEAEERWLTSPTAPIVLMKRRDIGSYGINEEGEIKKEQSADEVGRHNINDKRVIHEKSQDSSIAPSVAPGNNFVGIMLPYAPIHHLLLEENDLLVMTSGNVSDEPIAYIDADSLKRLKGIADYFLVHNRIIQNRVDDSVLCLMGDNALLFRRSRGLAPAPLEFIPSGDTSSILACGADLKNTFCITKSHLAFISEHIGDLSGLPVYQSYQGIIRHYEQLFNIKPQIIACDMHPGYLASKYGRQRSETENLPLIQIQHHHAHIGAVLAEYKINERVIGIALDGTGFGEDGAIWGGEIMIADLQGYDRRTHIEYLPLPGGDKAAKEPWRQALWVNYLLYGDELEKKCPNFIESLPNGWKLLLEAVKQGLNAPMSSSAGRLFDTASALLGIKQINTYEGQAAIELEMAARKAPLEYVPQNLGTKLYNFCKMPQNAQNRHNVENHDNKQNLDNRKNQVFEQNEPFSDFSIITNEQKVQNIDYKPVPEIISFLPALKKLSEARELKAMLEYKINNCVIRNPNTVDKNMKNGQSIENVNNSKIVENKEITKKDEISQNDLYVENTKKCENDKNIGNFEEASKCRKDIISEECYKLALDFHYTVAVSMAEEAKKLSRETGIKTVALGGGVFQNRVLLGYMQELLEPDLKVLYNHKVPINDGGLSFGQAAIAKIKAEFGDLGNI